MSWRLVNRRPFFPRPVEGPAGTVEFAHAEASAWEVGPASPAVPASAANQACQQKEKAQHTNGQWRRMARSLRTMKSAHPNSCLSCL
jgi:hypothetical protein